LITAIFSAKHRSKHRSFW